LPIPDRTVSVAADRVLIKGYDVGPLVPGESLLARPVFSSKWPFRFSDVIAGGMVLA
jgi:hypothetical protein